MGDGVLAVAATAVALVNGVVVRPRAVVVGLAVGVVADGVLRIVMGDIDMEPWEAEPGLAVECKRPRACRSALVAAMKSVNVSVAARATASPTVGLMFRGKKPSRRCAAEEMSTTVGPRVFWIRSSFGVMK